jgi:hypothetical protein
MLVSLVVALFTAPLNFFVDFVFDEIICAPTAEILKEKAELNSVRKAGRRMSNAVRRASITATNALTSAIATATKSNSRSRLTMFKDVKVTRLVPAETIRAQARATMVSASFVSQLQEANQRYESSKNLAVPSATQTQTRPASTTVVVPYVTNAEQLVQLKRDLIVQRRLLFQNERAKFDSEWGYVTANQMVLLF